MAITIPSSQLDENFNIDELTSGTLNGNGVFDVLMKTVHEHLKREHDEGRIRDTDYANAYIQLMQNALQQATQYSIQKAKLPLELQLLEANIHKTGAETVLTTKQGGLIDAQAVHEMAKNRQTEYITNVKLPAEVKNQEKQTELLEFELTKIKPKELELKSQQIELGKLEISLKEKQIPLMEKEIELKQNQIDLGHKEIALKEKQVGIAEKELDIKEQQLRLAEYEFTVKAPAEVDSIKSQTGLYNQKTITEKAQTDPEVIGEKSVIDIQNKLHEQQIESYLRDAEIKVLSVLIDTWKVRHNADPDFEDNAVNNINKLSNPIIGKAVEKALMEIGVSL